MPDSESSTGPTAQAAGDWFKPPTEGGAGLVTLVEGSTFCVAGRSADIRPGAAQGLFFLDTRLLSRLELRIDGRAVEPLAVIYEDPFSAVHVGRLRPPTGAGDLPVVVNRRRYLGRGMRDDVEIHNYGVEPVDLHIEVAVDSDFADLFAVKEGHSDPGRRRWIEVGETSIRFGTVADDPQRHVVVNFEPRPDHLEPGLATWAIRLEPGASWSLCNEIVLWLDRAAVELSHPCGLPVEHAMPTTRLDTWRRATPRVSTDLATLETAVGRALEDLGALRIFDPDHPDRVVVAAGAPWFMTLFGRDSILTAWMALIVDPSLARGVLETLADLQGGEVDLDTEEQPGRILHEVRFGEAPSLSMRGGRIYYGSVDATPLFVMLLGELRLWGLADRTLAALLPHADRALRWIDEYGDSDGDGYVEYARASAHGLLHQGWKDSWDGIRYADGRNAESPVALCEVQGYVYGAYLARARIADEFGEQAISEQYRSRAAQLKSDFNRDFWMEEKGWYAIALDRDNRQVDSLASNMGHCLWTGIVDEEHAPLVARRLLSPEMFSGWGLRTLATSMKAYNPVSYHCGSVWPHDTAIAAAGLMRYGLVDESHRLATALLDLAATDQGRLPELIAGFSRDQFRVPVPYPTSCSPQAWAAASPLLLLRTLLRLDPGLPQGRLAVDPVLPPGVEWLRVEGIPLGEARLTIDARGTAVEIQGAPPGVEVSTGQRAGAGPAA